MLIKKLGQDKNTLYSQLNTIVNKGQIVFVGDSLIENFPIDELYQGDKTIYNRGIAGSSTYDVLARLKEIVIPLEPSKVFLLVGTNDFMPHIIGNDEGSISHRVIEICDKIVSDVPCCKIHVISLFPINESEDSKIYKDWQIGKTNDKVQAVNSNLCELSARRGYQFINVYPYLVNQDGQLDINLTLDGTHVNIPAYEMILEQIAKYF
ncbi:MAG: GDSL-type esterase/lipase family protein [Hespellia sp.]|nr:GDSL-type esterase/lipase family protein [Hespellia sp.]